MSTPVDRSRSLEQLEGQRWPAPPEDTTSMVKNVHELRRRPVGELQTHELARLIGQNVGLPWLLPLAVEILRDTAATQTTGGWYDDDLLYAVVTRNAATWGEFPALARDLKEAVAGLKDLSRYVKTEVEAFLAMPLPDIR
ncbi:contact-dependent growth inhibition system immunity protein [Streptomyces prunicolor]|uniref:contact-dependent growth inhibition system immunity protein n=1 Tax=Streptomyces prunicolor TaxID=67348 RepID=UPI000998BD38|nr:contact-dependent growth inhibition system immunity protein [Streptomyces prunicolor]